jgi:plasmid stability protein
MLNEVHMASLTIRNLDDGLKSTLRMQAARHGHSMEEEVRSILRQALSRPAPDTGLGQRLASRFQAVATELPIPARSLPRTPPNWDMPA